MFTMTQSHHPLKATIELVSFIHSLSHSLIQRRNWLILTPRVYTPLVSIYLLHFNRSNLWALYDDQMNELFKTWNVMARMTFEIPRS